MRSALAQRLWHRVGSLEGGMASIGAGLCLLAIMMITVLGICGRYLLGVDLIPGGYNIIERIAFPLLVFWAVPMAHRQGSFPRFDLIEGKLPAGARRVVDAFVIAVEIVVFVVVFAYCARFAWEAVVTGRQMQIGTEVWAAWPVIVMIPLAFALILAEMVRLFWVTIRPPS